MPNKTYDKVQLRVKFTQASDRANIGNSDTNGENIAVSFGKLSKWYEALVPTGGSSGQFLGWNSDGTAKWVSNPNSDTKVKNTYGTANTYYPAGMTQSSTTTTTQVADTSFKFIGATGTTSEIGKAQLVLGNNITAGTNGNKQGSLVIYGSTAYAHTLIADSSIPTQNRTLYLPDKDGTLAVVGDIPNLYAGSNSTGGSALTVYGTLTNPSGQTSYAIPFHTDISSGDKSLLNNDGIVYTCKQGTASATGFGIIELGNAIDEGTAGNKYGLIRLYSRQGGGKYVQLYPATKLTANRNIMFPNAAGTVALTTDIPTVNDASLTLKGDGTDVVVFTANSASDKSLNITAGSNVTITPTAAGSNGAGTIQIASSHPTITKSADTTSTPAQLSHGGTFAAITSATRDEYGHVTTLNTATYTLPTIPNAGSILTPVYFSNNAPVESSGKTIPFIVGTGSTAGTWLGSLTGLTAYYDGLIILYKIPVAGANTTTLNINNLGAKTCYVNNTTKLTTHFPANQPIFLVYSENQNSGCWMCLDDYWTDSDTYDRNRYRANIKAGTSALVAANIIVGKDGVFNHLKSGGSFDISYPILYLNEAVAAGGTTKNSYDIINFTITTTQSISLTSYLPVFIKGTLSGKIFTPVSTAPLTQTVPTTDDGYQYMYLGNATSASAVYLTERHPIYVFKNGAFGEIVHTASNVNGYTVGKSVPSDAVFTDTKVTQTADNSSNSDNYELLISNSANNTTETAGARKSSRLRFNPSNGRVIMQGPLIVRATDGAGSYDEGIRINAGKNGYSTLTFGGGQDTISGTADGQFWMGTNSTNDSYKRKLYIAHAGSTGSGTYFYVSSASQVSPALKLGTSGSIATGNGDAVTGGVVYAALGNYLGAKSDGSYYGMANPAGADNVWIRTTSQGIIPYQSGGAGSGHSSLGTSSWYFAHAYIDTVHGSLDGNAATATKATQDESGNNIKATYAASFSISDHTITLKNKNDTSLGTVTVPDEKVKATKLAQSTAEAAYYPALVSGAGTAGVSIFDSAKINHTPGTTSVVGNTRLILGNATASGTANNEEGLLKLYSPGTSYHTLKGASTSSIVEHTLPTTGGTILNDVTTSFTQTLSSGTKIGTIKINGTSTDLYCETNTNTDTKVTQTNTTTSADYRVLLSGNANDTTETTTGRKSANLKFNPSSGGLYSFGFLWTDITGSTLDINTLTLSNGTLHSRRFIEKTDGGAANITNIPVTGKPFLLEVDLIRWASTTDYITRQRFTNAANGTYSYVRYCTSGTWGSWTTRKYTDTDTKVTSSANHYTPATASGQDKTASASGATAAWSIDVVKGVTLNTDGKGHVTGISVTSGKIPPNPVPSNNVTGSGTSGYLTKWNGTNTITNGPLLGSSTTTYLRNDGEWATPPDTKNTAGSTDTSSKIFLIGATSQAANPQTYSDDQCYVKSGALQVNLLYSTTTICANTANSNTAGGIALYSTDPEAYGVMFRGTSNSGKHGYVQSDWATYFTMNENGTTRGWVFRRGTSNVASISGAGNAVFNGSVTVGGNSTNTSGCRMEYNTSTQSLDFIFV